MKALPRTHSTEKKTKLILTICLFLKGTVLLWATTLIPGLTPAPCHESNNSHCSSTRTAITTSQLLLLCTSLGMIAVGGGGIRSSSLAFGIDQLFSLDDKDENGKKNGGFLDKFYGWYYATFMLSILIGNTLVVYIQDKMGWQIGFGVSVVLMLPFSYFFLSWLSLLCQSQR